LDKIGFRYFFETTQIKSLLFSPGRAISHKKVMHFQAGEQGIPQGQQQQQRL
jgi:hypothetical protein